MEFLKAIGGICIALFTIGGMLTCGAAMLVGSQGGQVATAYTQRKQEKEKAAAACVVEDVKYIRDGNYMYVRGYLRNKGTVPVEYVKVKATYLDKAQTVVDTGWTYAVSGEALAPNEARSFEIMTRNNPKARQATADVVIE